MSLRPILKPIQTFNKKGALACEKEETEAAGGGRRSLITHPRDHLTQRRVDDKIQLRIGVLRRWRHPLRLIRRSLEIVDNARRRASTRDRKDDDSPSATRFFPLSL